MLGVNLIHRDFEHVVAADAHAMNLYGSLVAGLRFLVTMRLVDVLCLTHGRILTQAAKWPSLRRLRASLRSA